MIAFSLKQINNLRYPGYMEKNINTHVAGQVWKLEVAEGDHVSKDQIICIIECMKMEIPVLAPVAGELSKWLVSSEDIVSEGQVIGILTAEE